MAKQDFRLVDAFALLILTVASIIGINKATLPKMMVTKAGVENISIIVSHSLLNSIIAW